MPDGTATAIVWEIAEYVAFIRNSTENGSGTAHRRHRC